MSQMALEVRAGFLPITRFAVGACGGLAAVCVKFLGQDMEYVQQLVRSGDPAMMDNVWSLAIGYGVVAPILMFLGGLIGWASEEKSRFKLLAMGVAAPALVTTWAGGTVPEDAGQRMAASGAAAVGQLMPITPALAQERPMQLAQAAPVGKGVRLFFGVGKQEPRYSVVVGEHRSLGAAENQVARLRAESPGIDAYVDETASDGPYRVLVGDYRSLDNAERARSDVGRLRSVEDATVVGIGG